MLVENLKNRKTWNVYEDICFTESVQNPKLAKMLLTWKKKHLNKSTDVPKVKKKLDEIAKLLGSNMDNAELMDKITNAIMAISKLVDTDGNNELADILGEI